MSNKDPLPSKCQQTRYKQGRGEFIGKRNGQWFLWSITFEARSYKEAAQLISYQYPKGYLFCVFSKITHRRVWFIIEGWGRVSRVPYAEVQSHVSAKERADEKRLFPRTG